jgi:hypothetical protein
VWPTCKSCGTLLMLPEPLTPVGAPTAEAGATFAGAAATTATPGAPAPGPPSEAEQFFAPAVLQPVAQFPPAASPSSFTSPYGSAGTTGAGPRDTVDTGKWIMLGGVVLFLIAAVATAYLTFGSAAKNHPAPVVLPPKAPTAGLPTSLDAIVRIQAESSRHTALGTVEQVGNGNIGQLAAMQPNYAWVGPDQASTDPHTVSVAQNGSTVTIAVSASSKDICAYGQWTAGGTPIFVTMAHEPVCAATTAPAQGWSTEPGGAASDLPDDPG